MVLDHLHDCAAILANKKSDVHQSIVCYILIIIILIIIIIRVMSAFIITHESIAGPPGLPVRNKFINFGTDEPALGVCATD